MSTSIKRISEQKTAIIKSTDKEEEEEERQQPYREKEKISCMLFCFVSFFYLDLHFSFQKLFISQSMIHRSLRRTEYHRYYV